MKKIQQNIFQPKGQIAFGVLTFILMQLLFPIEWGIVSGLILFIAVIGIVLHTVCLRGYLEMLFDNRRWARTVPLMVGIAFLMMWTGLYCAAWMYADHEGMQVPNFCFIFLWTNVLFASVCFMVERRQLMIPFVERFVS